MILSINCSLFFGQLVLKHCHQGAVFIYETNQKFNLAKFPSGTGDQCLNQDLYWHTCLVANPDICCANCTVAFIDIEQASGADLPKTISSSFMGENYMSVIWGKL